MNYVRQLVYEIDLRVHVTITQKVNILKRDLNQQENDKPYNTRINL